MISRSKIVGWIALTIAVLAGLGMSVVKWGHLGAEIGADGGRGGKVNHGFVMLGAPVASAACDDAKAAFSLFKDLKIDCDKSFIYVESATGLPMALSGQAEPKLMVGIKNFIMRVPIPFAFQWKLPLYPQWNATPTIAASRGPIGVAIDGVPIFHWDKRPDSSNPPGFYDARYDTVVQDELDQCGGHAGQGEDYHYHYAPVCLVDVHRLDKPIGYGIDGIPIYFGSGGSNFFGYGKLNDINNLPGKLDNCNGFKKADGTYSYYTTKEQPYTLGCNHAFADPALQINVPPFRSQGASQPGGGVIGEASHTHITDFYKDHDGWWHVEYDAINGKGKDKGSSAILFKSASGNDCWQFEYRSDRNAKGVHESYCRGT